MFTELIFLFSVFIEGTPYPVALVQTFRQEVGNDETQRKDNDLGFLRIHKQHVQFIWIHSIICGVPIFLAFDVEHDSIVFDFIDPDIAF